jgi:septal ring factor EnvC (AmiA/AmiB activator)
MEVRSLHEHAGGIGHGGSQPIALAAGALIVIVLGIGSIVLWRASSGTPPEPDRAVVARQLQLKAAQASEQLVEKTKGLEVTQQESIDQLQVVQDQLQTLRRQIAAQQADTKHLSEQVSSLTEAIDGLRQSFASVQNTEASDHPPSQNKSIRTRFHAARGAHGKARKINGLKTQASG